MYGVYSMDTKPQEVMMNRIYMEEYLKDWTTEDEIDFLKHIGSWINGTDYPGNHKPKLRAYYEINKERVNWGNIDKGKVINFIVNELYGQSLVAGVGNDRLYGNPD